MTGLEILRNPEATAEEIADIVSAPCPPIAPKECEQVGCRECWLAWLATGEPPKGKEPSDKQTAPDEEGLHPNLVEHFRKQEHLHRLLGEVKEYVNDDTRCHTSQSQ